MKRILIALDYDPTAQKVAETGHALGKAMRAEVVLMHLISEALHYSAMEYPVMGFGGYMNIDPKQLDLIDKQIKQTSKDFLEQTKKHLSDKSIQTLVTEGDPAESIIEIAKSTSADVIVMGSHSKKWLEQILMGSVAEKVLRHTTVPMFIIPTKKVNLIL
jgi:nucleotide-binding universal stress UspA family protein